jgi:hypothetical protein
LLAAIFFSFESNQQEICRAYIAKQEITYKQQQKNTHTNSLDNKTITVQEL